MSLQQTLQNENCTYSNFLRTRSFFELPYVSGQKRHNNPLSQNKSYIHVIVDAFSHFVVTVPIKSNYAKNAVETPLRHWIIKFGPSIYLVTDRGSKYIYRYGTSLYSYLHDSPRAPNSKRTNGFVEVQNKHLGIHFCKFLQNTPKDCPYQVHLQAYAHNSRPFSAFNVSPQDIVSHTRPRIPLTFDLHLNRITTKTCIS